MSMITGCPACGTMFRVVPDQLKISEGWVRCGHCGEVFDATAHLQPGAPAQQEQEALAGQQEQAPLEAPRAGDDSGPSAAAFEAPQQAMQPSAALDDPDVEVIEAENPYSEFPSSLHPPSVQPPPEDSGYPSDFEAGRARPSLPAQPGEELESEVPSSLLDDPQSELENVSFVRKARRRAFWRRPLVRLALFLAAAALAALLGTQYLLQERDRLAASRPELRPMLEQLCGALGCRIDHPRRIESIVIDSSGFTRMRQDTYRLSFTLKNQSAQPVAVPALLLTLTDTQDQPVVQRVLTARELGATAPTLGGQAEWSASVPVAVNPNGGARVAGYRLLAFYP